MRVCRGTSGVVAIFNELGALRFENVNTVLILKLLFKVVTVTSAV